MAMLRILIITVLLSSAAFFNAAAAEMLEQGAATLDFVQLDMTYPANAGLNQYVTHASYGSGQSASITGSGLSLRGASSSKS
jgi:hypothetical protein